MDWRFLVTIIITVALGIVAIVLALKLARKKKPAWARHTRGIIGIGTGAPPELELTFNGQPINNVYRTRFIFFNRGNETVHRGDVTQPILIQFQGAKILRSPMILAQSRQAIGASVLQVVRDDYDAVSLSFLYLDHNDGIVVEVIHTESQNIKCSGNIIGTNEIHYVGEFINPGEILRWGTPFLAVNGVVLVLAIVALALNIWEGSKLVFSIIIAYAVVAPLLIGKHLSFVRQGMKFPKWSRIKGLSTF